MFKFFTDFTNKICLTRQMRKQMFLLISSKVILENDYYKIHGHIKTFFFELWLAVAEGNKRH